MKCLNLPQPGRARRNDPDTAKSAAGRMDARTLKERILVALRLNPAGMTSEEIAAFIEAKLISVSPRLRPMVEENLVADSGQRRDGKIVWVKR